MASLIHSIRDNAVYASGYLQGRYFALPRSITELYALLASKFTRLITLPLPFLSFVLLPFFGSTSTTISVAFFYLTWSALVLSHDQLTLELYGTLLVRGLCFAVPALIFLGIDWALPSFSKGLKNRGAKQLPREQLDRNKLLEVIGISLANVLLAIALQGLLELLFTEVFHVRSILRVTTIVPLPWNILKDIAIGFALRGILMYAAHRYLLHTYDTPLKDWHLQWQHSISLPFSLAAAYDHPVNHLVAQWLPTFLPAYLFRFHVLTWHLFLALCSLEELFVFSGYAVLPSSIVLLGMARRMDEHFAAVDEGKAIGNFGRSGVLDFICGTTCKDEGDAFDDLQSEAEKHSVKQRAENAVNGAVSGIRGKQRPKQGIRGRGQASQT